jgi:hypothetical protein
VRKGDHLEGEGTAGRIILKLISQEWDWGAWTGLILRRIGTDVGLL